MAGAMPLRSAAMNTILAIGFGGGIGSIARYLTMIGCGRLCGTSFPWGTLGVNVLGSFVMGVLAEIFRRHVLRDPVLAALLTTGFLGGYTTFSTFSLDTALLFERGELVAAGGYIVASVVLSLGAIGGGLAVARALT
jgi:CrcB protein